MTESYTATADPPTIKLVVSARLNNVTNWRSHDYGDPEIEWLRKLQKSADAKRAKHLRAADAAYRESESHYTAIQRRVLQLLIGQAICMVRGATSNPDLCGDGVLLKVGRTRAEVQFGEWRGTVPMDWVRPAGDVEWFTWEFFRIGAGK